MPEDRASDPGQPVPHGSASYRPPGTAPTARSRRILGQFYRRCVQLLVLAMLLHLIVVFTPVGNLLFDGLDVSEAPAKADLILCLGGQSIRVIHAAELYHLGYAPKVVVSNLECKADEMRDLALLCGVPDDRIVVDRCSQTTRDHPAAIAALEGVDFQQQRFLIVTSNHHSRRAAACFRHGGYRNIIMYGRKYLTGELKKPRNWKYRFLMFPRAVYEYSGLLTYWLSGRI